MQAYTPEESIERLARGCRLDESTGCIEWNGCTDQKGYGRIRYKKKWMTAHRAVFAFKFGDLPPGAHVLHSCDNRRCVNDAHLFAGSNADNIADKVSKDRSGKKLCVSKVREIKRRLSIGESRASLAAEFGVNQSNITRIATGERWSHVLMKKEKVSFLGV